MCFVAQAELLAAKAKFSTLNGGVPYGPPKEPSKKVKGPAKTVTPNRAPGEKSKKVCCDAHISPVRGRQKSVAFSLILRSESREGGRWSPGLSRMHKYLSYSL